MKGKDLLELPQNFINDDSSYIDKLKYFVRNIIINMKNEYPYFYHLLRNSEFLFVTIHKLTPVALFEIMITDVPIIIVNPDQFFDFIQLKRISIDCKMKFIMSFFVHELLHFLLGHYKKRKFYAANSDNMLPSYLVSIAREIEVDSNMLKLFPEKCLIFINKNFVKKFQNFTFEEILSYLWKEMEIIKIPESLNDKSDEYSSIKIKDKKTGETFSFNTEDLNNQISEQEMENIENSFEQENVLMKKISSSRGGSGFGDINNDTASYLNINIKNFHIINWNYFLYTYFFKWKNTFFNYSKISRRNKYPPYRKRALNSKIDIIVAIDTSSSVLIETLEKIRGEIFNLIMFLKNFPYINLSIVEFTDKIVAVYRDIQNIYSFDLYGDGATDVRVLFNWISENKESFSKKVLMIIFTDGVTPYPDTYPNIPVLWFIQQIETTVLPVYGKFFYINY